ncbi:PREDICTED: cytoglobin-2 [Wasmannia auropunctata]|uniref:cytoglobin-2 n=1 Tax=Wasmannia auropunctata TaxID=64793 RepID=UPI0005EDFE80|nr:PREDICTED: cytoglobin-2 [Wasmannia auropunctata]XP_011696850.1 PREDICTED: cytoglobin-2 [Wasmannia auropunctata]XP_011696851.1 PREDICTED: cytoglobin-2 [Wasmannia auropunctata]XP_011696852.1 PREDICTED: cytoglobin-2 [Wasmannia auropunctata]
MALLRSLFDFIGNDNKLDEKLGLTEKQKKLVHNTWAIVRKDEVLVGVTVLIAYFKQYPESQKEFKSFKDTPLDELSKNKRFQAHCANVIATLGKVIEQMHDPELMEASLINFTEKHKTRGQTQQHFENLKQVMLDLFPSLFGKQYTAEVQEAWKKTLDMIFSKISQVYTD